LVSRASYEFSAAICGVFGAVCLSLANFWRLLWYFQADF